MTLDELIKKLQEAKSHGIHGNRNVTVNTSDEESNYTILDVEYDNRNVEIVV